MPPAVIPGMAVPLSSTAPSAEGVTPAAGMLFEASRGDHVHPRLTATGAGALDVTTAQATLTFSRAFVKQPSPVITLVEDSTMAAPVVFRVKSWIMGSGQTANQFVGAVIYGQRLRALPSTTAIVLLTNLLSALNLYEAWVPATGASFSYLMLASSQP